MRKIAAEDAQKVREELKRSSSESGDPQLRNVIKILIEKVSNLEKYEPILEELNQIKSVVKQKQISEANPAVAAGQLPGVGQIPAIIEFIKPYITPPDPFREMALQIMRSNLDLTNAIKNAVVGKVTGAEVKSE
jgi:hypothetical protein